MTEKLNEEKINTNENEVKNDSNLEEIDNFATINGDEGDLASALETAERNYVISSILNRPKKTLPPDFDGCCVECGEEIPKIRIEKLQTDLCVNCQAALEKKQKIEGKYIRERLQFS